MRAYIDSDVLIWHLRGERKAARLLGALRNDGRHELWAGVLQDPSKRLQNPETTAIVEE
jgi:hypothetical protein